MAVASTLECKFLPVSTFFLVDTRLPTFRVLGLNFQVVVTDKVGASATTGQITLANGGKIFNLSIKSEKL
jgi:hypothetical protein